ncbi:MAG: WYL domain-containing protein [bacterium]
MPKNKSASIRYYVIDKCLNDTRHKFPSLQRLADCCSSKLGKTVSTSTIEKDIISMKAGEVNGIEAPIVYSKKHKGYTYGEVGFSISSLNLKEEEWDALRYAASLLFQYKDIPVFTNFKSAIERINTCFDIALDAQDLFLVNHLQFEKSVANTGYSWIAPIYNAIRNQFQLTLEYENIYKKEKKKYSVQPYLLKEHRNRWYLIGWVEQRQDYLTFALDRILSLSTIENVQKFRKDFDANKFLQYSIGIMEGDGKPSEIKLCIKAPFNRLVLLEPIHPSQQVIKQTDKELHLKLKVNVNPELCHHLLSFGAYCKIQSPATLKASIKKMLEDAIAHY